MNGPKDIFAERKGKKDNAAHEANAITTPAEGQTSPQPLATPPPDPFQDRGKEGDRKMAGGMLGRES